MVHFHFLIETAKICTRVSNLTNKLATNIHKCGKKNNKYGKTYIIGDSPF